MIDSWHSRVTIALHEDHALGFNQMTGLIKLAFPYTLYALGMKELGIQLD